MSSGRTARPGMYLSPRTWIVSNDSCWTTRTWAAISGILYDGYELNTTIPRRPWLRVLGLGAGPGSALFTDTGSGNDSYIGSLKTSDLPRPTLTADRLDSTVVTSATSAARS
eukprot:6818605-Pyramimonas_sp.AAC.1